MNELNQIRNQKINEIVNQLVDSFSLSIQGSIQSIKHHKESITQRLKGLNIEFKIESQDSPWGYGIDAIKIDNIGKKEFKELKKDLLIESSQKFLELELIFSDSKKKIWFTHDSDVKNL